MAMAVVLAHDGHDVVVSATVAAELARLGITDVTLVRGDRETGVVLEGWAFDPATAPDAAAVLLGQGTRTRTLHPVAHTAVSTAPTTR